MALLFYDHDISSMQKELEEDLKEINCKIALSNTEQSLPTLRFDCDLLKTSVKKRTGSSSVKTGLKWFTKFYDGVHPKELLKIKWFSLMCKNVLDLH